MTEPDPRRDAAVVDGTDGSASPQTSAPPRPHDLRAVYRAASALRRGEAVVMAAPAPLALLSAERATEAGIAALKALAVGSPRLVIAASRAVAVARAPADPARKLLTLDLAEEHLTPRALNGLADPTAEQPAYTALNVAAEQPGGAEAAISLAKLARLLPALLVARLPAGHGHGGVLPEDIQAYPAEAAAGLRKVATAKVPLDDAPDASIVAFHAPGTGVEHLAIVIGDPSTHAAPLVRIHSECFTGDLLGSLRCDCGPQLRGAIRRIGQEGAGVVLYLSQEGRGIGLINKLRAYTLQDRGLDTFDANNALGWGADERNYLAAATMLDELGIRRLRLLTNNPDKIAALVAFGLEVTGRESHVIAANGVNDRYLLAKAERFGHWLD